MGRPQREPWSGVIADRFEIQRRLGTGGFGDVYAVYDRSRDSTVAMKVLHQTHPKSLQRFKREFRSLSGLTHQNLVQLLELMRFGDHWFFTMELVQGDNFLKYIRNVEGHFNDTLSMNDDSIGLYPTTNEIEDPIQASDSPFPVDWKRLRSACKQLAQGIQALHASGKLHCDLKPGNVLVSRKGRVVVLDFGMVSDLVPAEPSKKRMYAGTPQYMAPEQAMGNAPLPASDWYAFGIMLYQAMTGRFHVDAPNPVHILLRKQAAPPPDLHMFPSAAPQDLITLCQRLLVPDPNERISGDEVAELLDVRPDSNASWRVVTTAQSRRSAPFVGRKEQLQQLEETLSHVREYSTPKVVHISGPSGIGKTQLVRQFVTDIAPAYGAQVFRGRCYENEAIPFKAVDSLVDQITEYLATLSDERIETLFDRSGQLLTKLFPVLGQLSEFDAFPDSESVDHADSRRWAFQSFWELIRRMADGPIIFFVDDAQWGDADSGELLAGLLANTSLPLLLVTTFRDVETSPFLAAVSPEDKLLIELPELTTDEAEQLSLALTSSASVAKLIARESEGSPMFIDTLSRFLNRDATDSGTRSFHDVLRTRMQSMAPDARSLLRTIAIAGQPIERRDAREASRIRTDEQTIVAMLRNERLVRVNSDTDTQYLEIYHDRIREAIYSQLADDERVELHRRLAKIFANEKDVRYELVAHHMLAANEPREAATFLRNAASRAVAGFAYERAAAHYTSALSHGLWTDKEQLEIRVELAELLALMGRGSAAAEAYLDCGPYAAGSRFTDLRRRAADQLLRSGHVERGISILYDVMSELGLDVPRSDTALTFQIARLYLSKPRAANRPMNDRDLLKIDACFSAASLLGTIDVKLGAFFQLLHHDMALRFGDPLRKSRAYALQAPHLASEPKTRPKAIESIGIARELATTNKFDFYDQSFIDFSAGLARFLSCDFASAHELFTQVVDDLRQYARLPWEVEMVKIYDLYCLLVLGEFRAYRSEYPKLIDDPLRREDLLQANSSVLWSYVVAMMDDDPEPLFGKLEDIWGSWSAKRYHLQHFWHLQASANLDLYCGRGADAARRVASTWKALDKAFIFRTQLGRIIAHELRARSNIAIYNGGSKVASRISGSIKALRKEGVPYALAYAELLTGQFQALKGQRAKALESFASAETLATRSRYDLIATISRIAASSIEIGGEAVVRRNLAHLESQGIKDPRRFVRAYLPRIENI